MILGQLLNSVMCQVGPANDIEHVFLLYFRGNGIFHFLSPTSPPPLSLSLTFARFHWLSFHMLSIFNQSQQTAHSIA